MRNFQQLFVAQSVTILSRDALSIPKNGPEHDGRWVTPQQFPMTTETLVVRQCLSIPMLLFVTYSMPTDSYMCNPLLWRIVNVLLSAEITPLAWNDVQAHWMDSDHRLPRQGIWDLEACREMQRGMAGLRSVGRTAKVAEHEPAERISKKEHRQHV